MPVRALARRHSPSIFSVEIDHVNLAAGPQTKGEGELSAIGRKSRLGGVVALALEQGGALLRRKLDETELVLAITLAVDIHDPLAVGRKAGRLFAGERIAPLAGESPRTATVHRLQIQPICALPITAKQQRFSVG